MSELKQKISQPLGQIASGCFVLTAAHEGRSTGILASWVQQAGFDPPTVTVAVMKERPIRTLLEKSGRFVLNTIDDRSHAAMFKHFARGYRLEEPAFNGLNTRQDPCGVIIEDCLGHLSCEVVGQFDAGDHIVYVGKVTDGAQHREGNPCVHIRTNGFSY